MSTNLDISDSSSTASSVASGCSDAHGESSVKSDLSTNRTNDEDADYIKSDLASKETDHVNFLRFVVVVLLFIAAAGVTTLVYLISRRSEEEEANAQFEAASAQIVEAFEAIRSDRISALAAVAVAAIAHGVDHSRNWPFVSLSSFDQRSFTARSNSEALQVSLLPFVPEAKRDEWETYVISEGPVWIPQSIEYQIDVGMDVFIESYGTNFTDATSQPIVTRNTNEERAPVPRKESGYLPFWEMSPFLSNYDINVDVLDQDSRLYAATSLETASVVLGPMKLSSKGGLDSKGETHRYSQLLSIANGAETEYQGDPMIDVFIPIFDSFVQGQRKPVGLLLGLFSWANFFRDVLPDNIIGFDVVLRNQCDDPFTFRLNSEHVDPLGSGDLHEKHFDEDEITTEILEQGVVPDGTKTGLSFFTGDCPYTLSMYPSAKFESEYTTKTPAIIASVVAGIFAFAIGMFFVYDNLVERRQRLVLDKAVQSNAIVSSLFPKNVRDRLMQAKSTKDTSGNTAALRNSRLKSLLGREEKNNEDSQPIADLFPNCTVLFADISGFTAWSSTREPAQVFTLLQTLYQAFDKVAARRRVFKVETIGDSYVAVTGLPEPQEDHAVIMAKFARDCLVKMQNVTRELQVTLGPDTGDLSMRFGLNSGQVTAGVLRGDRARFQLFGDTVNTAARMESTGTRGLIQISQSTSDLLVVAGKEQWFIPRKDMIIAKGLGALKTYWLHLGSSRRPSSISGDAEANSTQFFDDSAVQPSKTRAPSSYARHVDWMTEVLGDYIKKLVAKRAVVGYVPRRSTVGPLSYKVPEDKICLDEVVEALTLPKFDGTSAQSYTKIELDSVVSDQLRNYVETIASKYHINPFHSFDHACHVTMSVHKLLKRVAIPDMSEEDLNRDKNHLASRLHEYTHGINSDPLTLLAIVFSALIHDVDHRGISNVQLGKEDPKMGAHYKHMSIAEQNSMDVAWDLLGSSQFEALRKCIFSTQEEVFRFRQVVVNMVLATDIFDKELNGLRKLRWSKAFSPSGDQASKSFIDNDLRATIVLEHIIQASDVSHTMQHWHIYIKWNRRLFKEMSDAHRAGRMASDPAGFWYQGELSFFDNYIIPLAKKLKNCQVFGVSSDEYLNYALSNRREWEEKGLNVVQEMIEDLGPATLGVPAAP